MQCARIFSVMVSNKLSKFPQLGNLRSLFSGATYSSSTHSGVASISGRFGGSIVSSGVASSMLCVRS